MMSKKKDASTLQLRPNYSGPPSREQKSPIAINVSVSPPAPVRNPEHIVAPFPPGLEVSATRHPEAHIAATLDVLVLILVLFVRNGILRGRRVVAQQSRLRLRLVFVLVVAPAKRALAAERRAEAAGCARRAGHAADHVALADGAGSAAGGKPWGAAGDC
jgi:hypothetical protein